MWDVRLAGIGDRFSWRYSSLSVESPNSTRAVLALDEVFLGRLRTLVTLDFPS